MELFSFYFEFVAHLLMVIVFPVCLFSGALSKLDPTPKPLTANRLYFSMMISIWSALLIIFVLKLTGFSTLGYVFTVLGLGSVVSSLLSSAFTKQERKTTIATSSWGFLLSLVQLVLLFIIGFKYVW